MSSRIPSCGYPSSPYSQREKCKAQWNIIFNYWNIVWKTLYLTHLWDVQWSIVRVPHFNTTDEILMVPHLWKTANMGYQSEEYQVFTQVTRKLSKLKSTNFLHKNNVIDSNTMAYNQWMMMNKIMVMYSKLL